MKRTLCGDSQYPDQGDGRRGRRGREFAASKIKITEGGIPRSGTNPTTPTKTYFNTCQNKIFTLKLTIMPKTKLNHLGIIMDGNRRWAKKKGLPSLIGHQKGYQTAINIADWCLKKNIKVLTLWAFSTENWNRTKKEIDYLMKLISQAIVEQADSLHSKNIRIQFLGRTNELSKTLQKLIQEITDQTKNNTRATLNIAFNYGGQAEIIDAVNKLIKNKACSWPGPGTKKVTADLIKKNLYDPKMPPPDLVIRTSGEMRTSGFFLWQSAYSELYFTKKLWPDFTEKDLDKAIKDFNNRQRRFGGN